MVLAAGVLALAAALPAAAQGALVSDEFSGSAIDPAVWSFVNPVGDASLAVSGGHASISVPAGVGHDLWTGANRAPRLLQAAPNTDFEVETKFDSAVAAQYQMQGIVVRQDDDDLLRFEVHHDGNGTRLFVAALVAGQATAKHYSTVTGGAPAYLRLRRAGDVWTLRYSRDGQDWGTAATVTHALTVTAIGPFAGNSGGMPPAFSASIDHFRVVQADVAPPVVTAVSSAPGTITAKVTWSTDEPATSQVAYGLTTSYGESAARSQLVREHSVQVSGLRCGRTYHYQARSRDETGNEGRSADATFQTGACPAALTSDEFNASTIDASLWSFVDPRGDVTLSANGSQAVIALPGGVDHDVWTGANTAPRLLQAVQNGDFEVELKFGSSVSRRYQSQGLIVQQDSDDLLRFDVYSDGGGVRLFAASMAAGAVSVEHQSTLSGVPAFLRVKRAGDAWSLRVSSDGAQWSAPVSFTRALDVSAVGPFAGNSGGPPPDFTGTVDHFRVVPPDVTGPQMSAVQATPGIISATLGWTTDEPATARVQYGEGSPDDGTVVATTTPARSHAVALSGLTCATTYHYRARSRDEAGNSSAAVEGTFATGACPSEIRSDEFSGSSIDTQLWTWVDPVGDGTIAANGSGAVLTVPAGVDHDLWTNANRAPRLLQSAPDADFEVAAKFDSPVTKRYQLQGIVVEGGQDHLLRFEVHSDGSATRLFAATIDGGVASSRHVSTVPSAAPAYLKIKRAGDRWTLRYSGDGAEWTGGTSFDYAMPVTAIGPFVGNSGATPPGFASTVDYFRLLPPPPPDTTAPVISNVTSSPRTASAYINWVTDEPADSKVEWGRTTDYGGTPVTVAERVTEHALRLGNLDCETTYHFRVRSADAAGNAAASGDRSFTTGACSVGGIPVIDVWYGDAQRFGQGGRPAKWINVLGSVSDPDGVLWVDYSLNGAPSKPLAINPDNNLRIAEFGDFNVELDVAELLPGTNTLELIASDRLGVEATKTITIERIDAPAPALPYTVDWAGFPSVADAAQVVDGLWRIESGSLRVSAQGYDRLVALGDVSWNNYEVTLPITIHSLSSTSSHAGVGVIVGWRGHEGDARPRLEWPLGSFCFYYRDNLTDPYQLWLAKWPAPHWPVNDGNENHIQTGVQYTWKMRMQPLASDPTTARYSCKVWPSGSAEPTAWNVSIDLPTRAGSVVLNADHADASFGAVQVRPLP